MLKSCLLFNFHSYACMYIIRHVQTSQLTLSQPLKTYYRHRHILHGATYAYRTVAQYSVGVIGFCSALHSSFSPPKCSLHSTSTEVNISLCLASFFLKKMKRSGSQTSEVEKIDGEFAVCILCTYAYRHNLPTHSSTLIPHSSADLQNTYAHCTQWW